MGKAISAKATYDPVVVEALFGTRAKARETFTQMIDAQEKGLDHFHAHGMTLTRINPKRTQASKKR